VIACASMVMHHWLFTFSPIPSPIRRPSPRPGAGRGAALDCLLSLSQLTGTLCIRERQQSRERWHFVVTPASESPYEARSALGITPKACRGLVDEVSSLSENEVSNRRRTLEPFRGRPASLRKSYVWCFTDGTIHDIYRSREPIRRSACQSAGATACPSRQIILIHWLIHIDT
jgi:hypothetical protein